MIYLREVPYFNDLEKDTLAGIFHRRGLKNEYTFLLNSVVLGSFIYEVVKLTCGQYRLLKTYCIMIVSNIIINHPLIHDCFIY